MNFFIKTLGCKVNAIDSGRISRALEISGHLVVNHEADADIVIVNSCTVTAEADRKSQQQVSRHLRRDLPVYLTGCSARVNPQNWQVKYRDNEKFQVVGDEKALLQALAIEDLLDDHTIAWSANSGQRTRLAISIQSGCDNRCRFCITRIARGEHHSRSLSAIIEEIKAAEAAGIAEIVLTGINLAAWGCRDSNHGEESRLAFLLEAILQQTQIPRIRLSSLGPQYLQPAFFDLFADQRLCDYLHLSLQSGSVATLQAMQRGHGVDEVRLIAESARRVRPDVALAADVITGFIGENELAHQQSMALLAEISFAKLHVFPYSPREGTPAAEAPFGLQHSAIAKARAEQVRDLGSRMRKTFIKGCYGKTFKVLSESGTTGLTTNYIRLKTPADLEVGEIRELSVGDNTLAE
ncbi:MAG: MiaB/RimO family radical SAM methylthiotransferase [Gammaproteobacteria bacterium]|nr:MiaB/RimO family radical SAM methylthiotransferase [Gammaproteobacteria bacterium]